jgi:NAD(P)-dependent dehydrogenase (short-subunit alcohol dehydrogenase family)
MSTSNDLQGHVTVVTGASRGLGRGIAAALAAQGARVVGIARSNGDLVTITGDAADEATTSCSTGSGGKKRRAPTREPAPRRDHQPKRDTITVPGSRNRACPLTKGAFRPLEPTGRHRPNPQRRNDP